MRVAAATLLLLLPAHAQPAASDLLAEKLLAKVRAIDDALDGVLGVSAVDLTAGTSVDYHALTVFPQASVIKVPVMIEVFRAARAGALRLEDRLTLVPSEAVAGGELYPALQRAPLTLTVGELVAAMIQSSDNTAANRLIRLTGMDRVNTTSAAVGLKATHLRRIMLDSAAVRRSDENTSTPADMARLMQLLHDGKAIDQTASAEMIAILERVDGDMRKTVPPAVRVASKTGEYPGTRTEAGIVYLAGRPFAYSICATFLRPGANPIPDVAALLFAHFDKLARSNRYGNRLPP